MIRFTPDTWVDAVMRPIAMAAPNAWVYIEIMAPDFRFALLLVAAAAAALMALRGGWRSRPTWVLLATTAAAFVPWLYTTGNGRYFMPFLLAVGPVLIALVYHLPLTKAFRLSAAVVAVAVQGVALAVNSPWKPWDSWEMVRWQEAQYFDIQFRPDQIDPNATYVTVSSISFSLLAPQFPETSHWINITSQPGAAGSSDEARRTRDFLRSARVLKVLLPTQPTSMTEDLQPDSVAMLAIDESVAGHRLRLSTPLKCDFFPSRSLRDMSLVKANDDAHVQAEKMERVGFWVCPLVYDEGLNPSQIASPSVAPANGRVEEALRRIEALCPRYFQPGQTGTNRIENGQKRRYPSADLTVYVLDNGEVHYKYDRSLNPQKFGTVQGLLDGSETPDCRLRGRTGLPWEREI
jgi:hypothetical protein